MSNTNPAVTLRDVASAAGVDVSTVSRVLQNKGRVADETRQRILQTARELGSSITAWSPLAQGKIADDAVIGEIARTHGKTNGQITLRWIIQQGVIAIPRTAKESRAAENFGIFDFELSADEMARISAQARPDGRIGDWLDEAFQWDQDA